MTREKVREMAETLATAGGLKASQVAGLEWSLVALVRDALEEAAQTAEAEGSAYEASAKECDDAGNFHGGTIDIHGVLSCKALAERIRALKPGVEATDPAATPATP